MLITLLMVLMVLPILVIQFVAYRAIGETRTSTWKDIRIAWAPVVRKLQSADAHERRKAKIFLMWALVVTAFWGWVWFKILEGAVRCCVR